MTQPVFTPTQRLHIQPLAYAIGRALWSFWLVALPLTALLYWLLGDRLSADGLAPKTALLITIGVACVIGLAGTYAYHWVMARALRCFLEDNILHYHSGRLVRSALTLRAEHVRHIRCSRNPLQRFLGTASLEIFISGVTFIRLNLRDLCEADAQRLSAALGQPNRLDFEVADAAG